MGYVRAEKILPEEIIALIQQYADGINIYIPRKEENKIGWGEGNETKKRLFERDQEIFHAYEEGSSVKCLAEQFFLSEKSIQRIVRNMRIQNR